MKDLLVLIHRAREEGNADLLSWLKRLAVALPGKMGQTGSHWEAYPQGNYQGYYGEETRIGKDGIGVRYRWIGYRCQREVVTADGPESVPAVAAWITSLGRMKLLEAIRLCNWEGVYYCDTDSLLCNADSVRSIDNAGLLCDNRPGYWRVVGEHARAEVFGIKHYSLDGRITCAGMPRVQTEERGGKTTYLYRRGILESVQAGVRPVSETHATGYGRTSRYLHGVLSSNGAVEPWRLEED